MTHWIAVLSPLPSLLQLQMKIPRGSFGLLRRFNAAVREGDTVAREDFPTSRPQNGTLDFGIAAESPAAVTTSTDSAETSSTAASFDAAVRGSDMAARECFLRLAHKTAHSMAVVHLPFPLM